MQTYTILSLVAVISCAGAACAAEVVEAPVTQEVVVQQPAPTKKAKQTEEITDITIAETTVHTQADVQATEAAENPAAGEVAA